MTRQSGGAIWAVFEIMVVKKKKKISCLRKSGRLMNLETPSSTHFENRPKDTCARPLRREQEEQLSRTDWVLQPW